MQLQVRSFLLYLWVVKEKMAIPVNSMIDDHRLGISIERFTIRDLGLPAMEQAHEAHRHDSHSFILLEKGAVAIEIDFHHYKITAPALIYLHPDQVHRPTVPEDVVVSNWSLTAENLQPRYLHLLEQLVPAAPLALAQADFELLLQSVALGLKLAERKKDMLYTELLKDSVNALVGLGLSLYLAAAKPQDKLSRFERVTRDFRKLLEVNYAKEKRPADYASRLNISVQYLNECVKCVTGFAVSQHIQQRVVLEAKRLLYHSDKSVKEIAAALGYDDYPYFARLFNKITGMTALTFRQKNRD